jgi:hypothetical protein
MNKADLVPLVFPEKSAPEGKTVRSTILATGEFDDKADMNIALEK